MIDFSEFMQVHQTAVFMVVALFIYAVINYGYKALVVAMVLISIAFGPEEFAAVVAFLVIILAIILIIVGLVRAIKWSVKLLDD